MPKIPTVDQKGCIGCGACISSCPKVFRPSKTGKSEVYNSSGDGEVLSVQFLGKSKK